MGAVHEITAFVRGHYEETGYQPECVTVSRAIFRRLTQETSEEYRFINEESYPPDLDEIKLGGVRVVVDHSLFEPAAMQVVTDRDAFDAAVSELEPKNPFMDELKRL